MHQRQPGAKLDRTLERYGPPEIFNSDQGSQFTSMDFTDMLNGAGVKISMDGKGCWMDNVFIERKCTPKVGQCGRVHFVVS